MSTHALAAKPALCPHCGAPSAAAQYAGALIAELGTADGNAALSANVDALWESSAAFTCGRCGHDVRCRAQPAPAVRHSGHR